MWHAGRRVGRESGTQIRRGTCCKPVGAGAEARLEARPALLSSVGPCLLCTGVAGTTIPFRSPGWGSAVVQLAPVGAAPSVAGAQQQCRPRRLRVGLAP
eukprot:6446222-Alexandrium_andersonii.AAC.1